MKKLYIVLLIAGLILGSRGFANVVTTTRKVTPQTNSSQPIVNPPHTPNVVQTTRHKLVDNVKDCKPYSENMNADFLGLGIAYKISIKGWTNNKCQIDFSAQTTGISPTFSKLYGIDPSQAKILSYTPKIQCAFTREQLNYVGDSILQEKERNAGATNNMLKDPNDILSSMSSGFSESDERLMDVLVNQGACQIINADDLNNFLNNFL